MELPAMELVVKTAQGEVQGVLADGVAAFKGIPYAAPPFGPNRFRPPAPPAGWDGVREATAYGPTAPKPPYGPPYDLLLPEPVIPGEDCLNLNVWTPDPGGAGLPVMVWIHGGAFVNGSGAVPTYDGTRFARDGVVLVTVNYRLGADGFAFFDDGGPVNLGLRDQIAALEWVRDNVAAFGGDARNVTIFGESAGAMSVTSLLSSPLAAGLFRRVAAQSGAGSHALTPATARRVAGYLAERLGVEPTRDALAAVPIDRLVQAQFALTQEAQLNPDPARWGEVAANLMAFEPVVDGDVLPAMPLQRVAAGAGAGVDLLVGTTTEEMRLFMVPNGALDAVTDDLLRLAATAYGLPVERALPTYAAGRPGATPGELLADIGTDWFFRIPAVRLAEARPGGPGGTWVYEFGWRSPEFGGRLGACHALEIGFVFDTLDAEGGVALQGRTPPQRLAERMHRAWVAFATAGDPGWPRYDQDRRPVQHFGDTVEVLDDPRAAQRELWEGVR
jgi:para-nitrobenzyl esterase